MGKAGNVRGGIRFWQKILFPLMQRLRFRYDVRRREMTFRLTGQVVREPEAMPGGNPRVFLPVHLTIR